MTLPPKYMALAGKLTARITVTREIGGFDVGSADDPSCGHVDGEEVEREVEVTGTYHRARPAKRDGGNIVEPPEDESIELDDPWDLTRAQQEQAIEALREEHAEQVGRLESQREDYEDGKRDERRRHAKG